MTDFKPPWMEETGVSHGTQPQPVTGTANPEVMPPGQTIPPVDASQNQVPSITTSQVAPQKSLFTKIIPIIGILIFIGLIAFLVKTIVSKNGSLFQLGGKNNGQITLTYWGLWEPDQVMKPVIDEYKKTHPNVTINYVFQSPFKDYRARLQSSLAAKKGPDIFRIHVTWLPMFKSQMSSVPGNLVSWTDYYPSTTLLKADNDYYAVPMEYDGLALYYNTDIFNTANVLPPTDWVQLRDAAQKLLVAPTGKIERAGIALGTTNNVDNFSDIVALMMLQEGADPGNPAGATPDQKQRTLDALKFYTYFYRVDRVWDETLPSSVYAFATGKVAMMIAPSWRAFDIKNINQQMQFKTIPLPQLSASNKKAWASYWAEGVAKDSSYQKEAWDFIKYLSQKETLKTLYDNQSKIRLFGEPFPLQSMAKDLEGDPVVSAFISQAPYAQSWYLCSATSDSGINDKMIKYYEDAINGINQGKSDDDVITQLDAGVKQVLSDYQLTVNTTQ